MVRIMVMTDDLTMAGSFWRSGGWLSQLLRDEPDDFHWTWYRPDAVASGNISWAEFRSNDIVFMHRPCLPQHVGMMQRAQDLGLKVWVDYDDWLWDIPIDNETFMTYETPNIRQTLDMIVKHADIVSTSTRQLRSLLNIVRGGNDVLLTPNALPLDWFNRWRERYMKPRDPNKTVIAWRGSRHHQRDLLHAREAIINVSKQFPNLHFEFIGFFPWFIAQETEGVLPGSVIANNEEGSATFKNRPPTEVTLYFKHIIDSAPDIVMTPLYDSMFNKAKSNIAWIESMWAGAKSVIAPDWEEWRQPGVELYKPNDMKMFEETLGRQIERHKTGELDRPESGWHKIQHHYSLSKINQIRLAALTKPLKSALMLSAQMEPQWYSDSKGREIVKSQESRPAISPDA
jgi:hypothetical protein